ncbi:MAG: hypothetical protein ACR2NP_09950 [Pirellulaceae bacterium]
MKSLFTLVIGCLLATSAQAQIDIGPEQWQADLRFLQSTVHDDYSFLFRKTTAEQFDAAVDQLHDSIPKMQEHEIVTGLARIVAMFGYGHTRVGIEQSRFHYHMLPINLYQFSDGVFIEGAHKDHASLVGAQLVAINGVAVDQALEAIRPVVPVENEQYFKANGLMYVCSPEVLHAQGIIDQLDNDITLTLQRDGQAFEETLTARRTHRFPRAYGFVKPGDDWITARPAENTPLYLKQLDRIYYFEYLPEQKTVYVRHSQIQDDPEEDIPAFYQRLFEFIEENDVEKLVLDVRLNGGGNNYKNKPIVTGVIRSDKINQPGKFFVIIGRRTFSACQNLVNELDNYTNAVFVGEPTSENINFYGDNRRVELPNSKIPVFLSFAWWQDKPPWENEDWIAPHVAVDVSFADYAANRDPVLDAALGFSGDDFIIDPMAHLSALFQAGKREELQALAEQLVNDPRYQFVNFETEANEVGYQLLNDNQLEAAMFVFQLNNKLYPDSANTWDSLAEVNWKAGEIEQAIELYNKAIELDPDGPVGDNARTMLKQIEHDDQ